MQRLGRRTRRLRSPLFITVRLSRLTVTKLTRTLPLTDAPPATTAAIKVVTRKGTARVATASHTPDHSCHHSTFYQYWRSNACNVNVWYGFKNECHGANKHTMGQCDCFKEKKGLCGGMCRKGGCEIVEPCDCGPAPAEWCDSCDGN